MRRVLRGLVPENRLLGKPTKVRVVVLAGLVILMVCSGFMGGLAGYYLGTGEYPWMTSVAILPAGVEPETTLIDIGHFLEGEPIADIPYGYGYNCVEDALLLARNANWQGLPAEPARLMFEDGTGHLVLIFPTEDGWVFVDAQKMEVINPVVGGVYFGRRITSIERLVFVWAPIEWEVK